MHHATPKRMEAPNKHKWDRLYNVVLVGVMGVLVGQSWNYTITNAFGLIENTTWKFVALSLWCLVITMAFVAVIWMTTEKKNAER